MPLWLGPLWVLDDTNHNVVAIFEQKHTETAEKIQEVTVLTSNIQVQVKAQEQKMVEQSANDMNEIKAQLKDVDAGHQTLVQKVSGMENGYDRAKPAPGPRLAAVGCGVLALVSAAAVGGVFVGRATKDDGKGSGSMPPAEHKSGITAPSC